VPVFPAALRPGDLVAVVAPAGPPEPAAFWRGLGWVRDRYRVRMSPGVLSRAGYFAGDDARRAGELAAALGDPEVRAVVAARGGYGAMRVLERLSLEGAARTPRWIVGFSDVTALHVAAAEAGLASIHGPNVTGLGHASPCVRAAWLAALERPGAETAWTGLGVVHAGRARGRVWGGNLALLEAMAAAGRLAMPDRCVLAVEDVDERPYRVDRMLTSLRMGGCLARAAAIVFGGFKGCGAGKDGTTVEEVLAERTADLGVPVLAGAPFGHGEDNRAFVMGREAVVGAGEVVFPGF
jgi:muramoyltetrapeptide carboxypeptidase